MTHPFSRSSRQARITDMVVKLGTYWGVHQVRSKRWRRQSLSFLILHLCPPPPQVDGIMERGDTPAIVKERAAQLRELLTALGPSFIKAGQVLANR